MPTQGSISRNGKLRIGRYNQHSEDVLNLQQTPLEFVQERYKEGILEDGGFQKLEEDKWRNKLGMYGISGHYQTKKMHMFSDGLKTRVVMMMLALERPHILLLDEPTNHLDMESIDSLAKAINSFSGGTVLVSHDFRLIGQVAKEIWLCDQKTVKKWQGGIQSYKEHLKSQVVVKR